MGACIAFKYKAWQNSGVFQDNGQYSQIFNKQTEECDNYQKKVDELTPNPSPNSHYFKEISYVLHSIIFACIVTVWELMISNFSNADGVALYTFDLALPSLKLSYTPTYTQAHITYNVEMSIMDFCLTPDLYQALQASQPSIITQYSTNPNAATAALVSLVGSNYSSVVSAINTVVVLYRLTYTCS